MSNEAEQIAFTKIVTGLRAQGRKSQGGITNPNCTITQPFCRYRGIGGAKCAIGMLIPDADYNFAMESLGLLTLAGRISALDDLSHGFLREMRGIHDAWAVDCWEARWELYANEHDLEMPS